MKIEQIENFILNNPNFKNNPFSIITHHGDLPVTKKLFNFVLLNTNLKKWYGQNVEYDHPKITSIPIGLENDCHYRSVGKRNKIYQASKYSFKVKPTKMAYMNFSFWTRRDERIDVRNTLKNYDFVTDDCVDMVVQENYSNWIENVLDHQYVICPRGNGVDTHRLWETLYLGRIPIVKKEINTRFYEDLPILFVDSWSDITESLLKNNLENLSSCNNYNLERLKFSYWKNKIKEEACNGKN